MNKVVLVGRLTKDPNCNYAASGTAVTRFTLAVNRQFKKDEADFISCIAFGKTAETLGNHMAKGKQVAICGNIRTGSYDKDGTRIYTTDVVIETFDFLGTKDSGQANQGNYDFGGAFSEPDSNMDWVQNDYDMPF
ncbi:single-stranded DNA-binding protein [Clostridium perfringens]|uniref:single-stranded DNA-binding protein n=1 Tax=Clostridium perfringens TaxID=1502 RepID=UPI001CCE30C1|nr:single-stranded DNA-binding protein [Clostridium perfringens]UBK93106.1 single-stranded DNA-binding protein [Clostridium perfringens]